MLAVWLVQSALGFAFGGIVAFVLTAAVLFFLPRAFGGASVVSHRALVYVSPKAQRTKIYWGEAAQTSRAAMGWTIEARDERRVFIPRWHLRGERKRQLCSIVRKYCDGL